MVSDYRARLTASIDLALVAISLFNASKQTGRLSDTRAAVNAAVENLLANLCQYEGALFPFEKDDIFSRTNQLLDLNFLISLSPGSVPVAIMRALLNSHRVLFDPSKCPSWINYYKRYAGSI